MPESLLTIAYLAAGALFILSLGGLSAQETARRGNIYGVLGMVIALVAITFSDEVTGYGLLALATVPALAIGAVLAARVQMTSMPQLVAILHSFVGLAAVFVGIATHLDPDQDYEGVELIIHSIEIAVGIGVGSLTFTGSVIACLKLQGIVSGSPLIIPFRHVINLIMLAATVWMAVEYTNDHEGTRAMMMLLGITALTGILGIHLVMAIGGADMPVVVSMLNSYSGWAAAAAGFMLSNDLLIITGALVGSSGAILSLIMCRGMNRSLINVILGGFGTGDGGGGAGGGGAVAGEHTAIEVDETVAQLLADEARDHHARIRHGGRPGPACPGRHDANPSREGHRDPLCDPSRRGPPAGAHERAPGRSQRAIRHRARDGRDQRGLPRNRRRARNRSQRHREPERPGRPDEPDRRHARPGGMEVQVGRRDEAFDGERLCRRRQPAVLQGQHGDALRRRERELPTRSSRA